MNIKEFIGYYRLNNDKKAECEKHITTSYIPFINKITECARVVKATMEFANEDGTVTYNANTPMRYLIFHMTLIGLYSDIELSEDLIDDYDALNEQGAFDMLISCIPEHELKEFTTLLSMSVDDYITNERELTSYLDKKMVGLAQYVLENAINENKETGDVENG